MTQARLRVNDPLGHRVVTLDRPVFVIGRRDSADLTIAYGDVSREHAEIALEDGHYVLRDKASRFGTYVNGERIVERVLQHGDRICLGTADFIELVFLLDGTASSGLLDSSLPDTGSLRQMAGILNGLRALGSGAVLEEILTLVMDAAVETTKADRGFIMLADKAGELQFKIARGRGREPLTGTTFTTSETIPRQVFETGTSYIARDLMADDLKRRHPKTIKAGIRQVLCVPLRVTPMSALPAPVEPGRIIGVLYLDGQGRSTMGSPATQSSLEGFATQAALAIESARLYAESAEKARIDHDLRNAAEIQRNMLPEPAFENEAVDLAAVSIPCRTVGGDFYDYLEIDERGLGFAIGDVSGKGPPAALLAASVQSNFVALAPVSADPAETMTRLNKALLRRAIEARFSTMFHGELTMDGRLRYCNAGQEPPLVIGREGVSWLDAGGPVLGLLPAAVYASETVSLEPGDLVIVCSDGVTEARNTTDDEFGRGGLVDAVRVLHGARPEVVLDRLIAAIKEFSNGAQQADDITALVIRYRGRG
jgi:sigma-B regulation protein RsbU (phosphoserine phosphatase)